MAQAMTRRGWLLFVAMSVMRAPGNSDPRSGERGDRPGERHAYHEEPREALLVLAGCWLATRPTPSAGIVDEGLLRAEMV